MRISDISKDLVDLEAKVRKPYKNGYGEVLSFKRDREGRLFFRHSDFLEKYTLVTLDVFADWQLQDGETIAIIQAIQINSLYNNKDMLSWK